MGKKNLKLKTAAVPALLIFIFLNAHVPLESADRGKISREDKSAVLQLAERQAATLKAEFEGNFTTIYGLLTPEYRQAVPLPDFLAQPFAPPRKKSKREKDVSVSGSKTTPPKSPNANKKPAIRKFPKSFLGYRFIKFNLSEDGKDALVTYEGMYFISFMSMALTKATKSKYWKNINGQWYAEPPTKYRQNISGAKAAATLPRLTRHFTAVDIAREFFNDAKLAEGSKRTLLLENAFLIDPFETTGMAVEEKIDVGELPMRYIDRAMPGAKAGIPIVLFLMEAGKWYELAGNVKGALELYEKAMKIDYTFEPSLVSATNAAVKLGRWKDAAKYYGRLLTLAVVKKKRYPPTIEPYIKPECTVCRELEREDKIRLANSLLAAQKWGLAAVIYENLITENDTWQKTKNRLLKGEAVTLAEILGEDMIAHAATVTYHEIAQTLKNAKIGLYHPADLSVQSAGFNETISASSVRSLNFSHYGYGVFASDNTPNLLNIAWPENSLTHNSPSDGIVAVFLFRDTVEKLHVTKDKSPLAKKISEMETGQAVLITGLSLAWDFADKELAKAYKSVGVEAKAIKDKGPSYVIFGVKGAPPGSAAVWTDRVSLRKVFTPANHENNHENGKRGGGQAIVLSGKGAKDPVRWRP
ncbi:MAG: hypothetical protein V3S46_04920 [Nitrospinota bacterium]